MANRTSNKRVKAMICGVHKSLGCNVVFEPCDRNKLTQWSLCCGDGFSEWVDYRVIYGAPISLTAEQMKPA